jgi:hypothetical protein
LEGYVKKFNQLRKVWFCNRKFCIITLFYPDASSTTWTTFPVQITPHEFSSHFGMYYNKPSPLVAVTFKPVNGQTTIHSSDLVKKMRSGEPNTQKT